MNEYIQKSFDESGQKVLINSIQTFVLETLPPDFDLEYVLQTVREAIPEHLIYGLESILIGKFDDLEEKDYNAVYKDGAIYVTNEQNDEDDLVEDIIHEIAHLVEDQLGYHIYDDRKVVDEFLGKRGKLYEILNSEGYNIPREYFYELEYNEEFDHFLHKVVGYEKLTYLSMGLFISPYAITNLREYFAKSFQRYFMNEMEHVKTLTPAVFQKIEFLVYKKHE